VSQQGATGTVTLTAVAPSGAVVAVESSDRDVARSPATVSVAAGQLRATFPIETSTVGSATTVTFFATYAGVNRTTTFTVRPPTLEPKFTVESESKGAGVCAISNGDGDVDCRMDATTSVGIITSYNWSFKVKDKEITKNTSDPVTTIDTDCDFLKGADEKDDGTTIEMIVSLSLRGRDNTTSSSPAVKTIKVYHNDRCNY
jgi:hypothetical protein